MFIVVEGPVVNHMAGSCPRVGQQMLHKVLPLCEIPHGSVLQHTSALIVAVHRPHLMKEEREIEGSPLILSLYPGCNMNTSHAFNSVKFAESHWSPALNSTWIDNDLVFGFWLVCKPCPCMSNEIMSNDWEQRYLTTVSSSRTAVV